MMSTLLLALAIPMFGFLIVAFFLKGHFGSDRAYDLGLIVLAPFGLIGYLTLMGWGLGAATDRIPAIELPGGRAGIERLFSVFLVLFLLFNAGVVYHVTGTPYTLLAFQPDYDYPTFSDEEIEGVEWVARYTSGDPVYADRYGEVALDRTIDHLGGRVERFWADTELVPPGAYVYFRSINLEDRVLSRNSDGSHESLTNSSLMADVNKSNKIYASNGAVVYQRPVNGTATQ